MRQLKYLNDCLPETAQPSIDDILQVERNARCNRNQVLACRSCTGNRSSLLLLSIVAERIIKMLEVIFERKAIGRLRVLEPFHIAALLRLLVETANSYRIGYGTPGESQYT